MEIYEREQSPPRRSSIKRPWEDDTPDDGNAWKLSLPTPIDTDPYQRASIHREADRSSWNSPYATEPSARKVRYEGHEYNTFPRQKSISNGKLPQSQNPNSFYPERETLESAARTPKSRASNGLGPQSDKPSDPQQSSDLCRRCKRLTTESQDSMTDDPDDCDCRKNPELAWVSQECSRMLSNLAATLSTGILSDQSDVRRGVQGTEGFDCPPMGTIGVKQTLKWLLGRVRELNNLADQLVGKTSAGSLQNRSQGNYNYSQTANGGSADIMKRRFDNDSEDWDETDLHSDTKSHTKRKFVSSMPANEDLPPSRSQPDYHLSLPPMNGSGQRASMNPPTAPNRHLLSPSGRSLLSPLSLGFSSPSTPHGVSMQGVNLPPPSSIQSQTHSNYLPPINTARTPESALQDHTASLQHEVSVQKIALSSLQGEHDKLLAAFSRSQTRASALERKHAVSDSEIVSLTEEKLRLQAQVLELERDVEELARSRDQFRQAAVQEGAQYVEIVQRASRLEEIAGEERRNWGKLREEMERSISSLKAGIIIAEGTRSSVPHSSRPDDLDMDIVLASEGPISDMETKSINDLQSTTANPEPSIPQESVEDLKMEMQRLRERCAHVESALRVIRDDSRSMEDIVRTLVERADLALQS